MPRTWPGRRPSRRERRKQQRSQKKARKAEHFSKKKKKEGASLACERLAIVPESHVGKRDDRRIHNSKDKVSGGFKMPFGAHFHSEILQLQLIFC